jgi:hypothetical protein
VSGVDLAAKVPVLREDAVPTGSVAPAQTVERPPKRPPTLHGQGVLAAAFGPPSITPGYTLSYTGSGLWFSDPTLYRRSTMTAAKPLARYRARSRAAPQPPQLHHPMGHDRRSGRLSSAEAEALRFEIRILKRDIAKLKEHFAPWPRGDGERFRRGIGACPSSVEHARHQGSAGAPPALHMSASRMSGSLSSFLPFTSASDTPCPLRSCFAPAACRRSKAAVVEAVHAACR